MHLTIWIFTALLFGLWTLLAYGTAALVGLAGGLSGGMPSEWYGLIAQIPGAPWLDLWLPGWREALVWSAQVLGAVLGWLGGAAPVIVWVVWGLGTGVLVLCAALLSGLVALVRRTTPRPPPTPPAVATPPSA
ncbi:MAG: hypothetical protein JNJ71_13920 [Rubrivivax sp.]|nr:hypothetical protein [Rubrivivax sp.]